MENKTDHFIRERQAWSAPCGRWSRTHREGPPGLPPRHPAPDSLQVFLARPFCPLGTARRRAAGGEEGSAGRAGLRAQDTSSPASSHRVTGVGGAGAVSCSRSTSTRKGPGLSVLACGGHSLLLASCWDTSYKRGGAGQALSCRAHAVPRGSSLRSSGEHRHAWAAKMGPSRLLCGRPRSLNPTPRREPLPAHVRHGETESQKGK